MIRFVAATVLTVIAWVMDTVAPLDPPPSPPWTDGTTL